MKSPKILPFKPMQLLHLLLVEVSASESRLAQHIQLLEATCNPSQYIKLESSPIHSQPLNQVQICQTQNSLSSVSTSETNFRPYQSRMQVCNRNSAIHQAICADAAAKTIAFSLLYHVSITEIILDIQAVGNYSKDFGPLFPLSMNRNRHLLGLFSQLHLY